MIRKVSPVYIISLAAFLFGIFLVPEASGQTASATGRIRKRQTAVKRTSAGTRPRVSPRRTLSAAQARRVERDAFDLINLQRKRAGARALKWNSRLASLARTHSSQMALYRFFSHRGRDGSLVDKRATDRGIDSWSAIGENIAYMRGYDDPAAFAVERWMLSPSHRTNLLDRRWRESAIGLAIAEDGTYYLTQVFMFE